MNSIDIERSRKARTFVYVWILLALLILLVAATYTWFSLSHTPRVSDMAMYVSANSGLELAASYNAKDDDWKTVLDFQSIVGSDTQLAPATWSSENSSLYSIFYGYDGRARNDYMQLFDGAHSNRSDSNAYYVKGTFYARSGVKCQVSLAEAVEVNDGENGSGTYVIGTPIWNEQSVLHDNGGSGAETAVRIGFMITPVDAKTGESLSSSEFYIYEPNCDRHIDSGISGYVDTGSMNGDATLIDKNHLILQTASKWTEAYPVQRDVVIKELGNFITDTDLFSLEANDMVKIDLYIWLEGEDIDCTNKIQQAQIVANIQFDADTDQQSGLVDIPQ